MKKLFFVKLFFVLSSLFFACGFSQPPAGYYNSATGTGYELKTQLYNIIKDHNFKSYSNLWNLFKHTEYRDLYYENDNTLLDLYSEKPSGPDSYSYMPENDQCGGNYTAEGHCYNREHVIPQSVFGSGVPRTDAHHIIPTDGYVNGMRSNHPIGEVNAANWTSTNGSKRGTSAVSGYSGTVFEPIDEFKGDFARMFFYFATRYQNQISNWSFAMFNGTSDQVFTDGFLDILLRWHENDPVSPREIAINNRIYQFQNNRNPYIDHPEFVQEIWGNSSVSVDVFDKISVSIFPNPSKNRKINIVSDRKIEEIWITNLSGQLIQQIEKPYFQNNLITLDSLPVGFYILNLSIDSNRISKKIILN